MDETDTPAARSPMGWMLRGALAAFSIPAIVLMAAQIGFAALAREAGFSLGETLMLTVVVWALPSQAVFVGLVGGGASLLATVVAVGFSAVRFMPMVMSWVPVVRGPNTRRWQLFAVSWFVAITAWVFAMAHLPQIAREHRLPFFTGFSITLTSLNGAAVIMAYNALGAMPALLAAGLVFLTPVYFLLALWGAARSRADLVALGAGLLLGPPFAILVPEADLLLAGLIGGTGAYVIGRVLRP